MRKVIVSALAAVGFLAAGTAFASGEAVKLEKQDWSWVGLFGQYDQAQLKRGWQVYSEVCSACHSLNLVAYRNLSAMGFTEDQIKEIAAQKEVTDGPNDEGEMFQRPARPSDKVVRPYANDALARVANNGALPPDLSLMNKARIGGPDYVYNFLVGFHDAPEGFTLNPGMYYNTVFPGHQVGMPPQVEDDRVEYADGTKATKEQIAKDVTAFLNWAAEPEMNERHSMGFKVLLFLVVLTAMLYALKRKIWADVH